MAKYKYTAYVTIGEHGATLYSNDGNELARRCTRLMGTVHGRAHVSVHTSGGDVVAVCNNGTWGGVL